MNAKQSVRQPFQKPAYHPECMLLFISGEIGRVVYYVIFPPNQPELLFLIRPKLKAAINENRLKLGNQECAFFHQDIAKSCFFVDPAQLGTAWPECPATTA